MTEADATGPTLLKPPEKDPTKAPIENTVEVTPLTVLGPDIFTNTRQAWLPRGARGIYGGAVIAQSLAAAQLTVPDAYLVHSCHCYFLLAGSADVPIMYHVERVRDGRSFVTRTVQARQGGRCIFTTTASFMREDGGGAKQVRHAVPLPSDVALPETGWDAEEDGEGGPWRSRDSSVVREGRMDERRCRRWMRCKGRIAGGHRAHLNALAYLSDSYFVGTVSRIHGLWRWDIDPRDVPKLQGEAGRRLRATLEREGLSTKEGEVGRRLGMQVSLDHSIYFHEPRRVRADEWMFMEMESPWAGDGRGVVLQRIWAGDGTLLASCVQEGVVRLKQDGTQNAAKI